MGILEREVKITRRNQNIQKAILGTIATAGLLTVVAVAPNVFQVLGMLTHKKGSRFKEYVDTSRKRLVKNNLLEYTDNGFLKLTVKGEAKLRQLQLHEYKTKKPKHWDKKWRVLIFDIREERRPLRDKVRNTLVAIGFLRLQDSVWVYPYDCEDIITLLKADFKIGSELLYLIVEKIENDSWLKREFKIT